MKVRLYLLFGLALTLWSCGNKPKPTDNHTAVIEKTDNTPEFEGLLQKAQKTFGELPAIANSETNTVTTEKVALGQMLYFDNRLSKDNKQSCNTCHNVATYGVDNMPTSEGNDGGFGDRNSPTTFNAAFHIAQFWDGREPDVEAQAGGPILNPVEMAMHSEADVVTRLKNIDDYVTLFGSAFPEEKDPITYNNLKKAIGAYERKLVSPSRFDDYLAGNENALSHAEKKGLETYMNSGCVTCHSGNLLGGNMYQKFGLMGGNYWELTGSENIDEGRFTITQNEADKYVFKVPSLRNIEKTYPYFHDGSVSDLKEAVMIMAKLQVPQPISETQADEIVTFLKTLTGNIPAELAQVPNYKES
ncbi:MAG: cytochrome-c peroxidase [Bacteroidia bacterium]